MSAAIEAAPRGFQDIRALPVQAGGAVFFTHRVIHWGSASRAGYPTPRIACSWAATADDYEKPYFSRYAQRVHRSTRSCCTLGGACCFADRASDCLAENICPSRLRRCERACALGSNSTTTSAFAQANTSSIFTTECLMLLPPSLTPTTKPRFKGSTSGPSLRWQGASCTAADRVHAAEVPLFGAAG